jgi:hypothetical protein
MNEDFESIIGDLDGQKIEVEELESSIRESWGMITKVAGGIYNDCLEYGLPEDIGNFVTKEFLYRSLAALGRLSD